ncbi:MAG: phosphodiester glycosidase family protein, partial [Clostridia bacterium]|nr:phosphodiester glycosidase family protein [Clostridia bacterium]
MLRKLLALLLLFSLLPPVVLGADILYETKTQETVAQGITYTKWMRMQESGISQIHIIDADLNNDTVTFRPMAAPKGMSYLSNVLNMAKTYGAVAAVNTDFFSWNQTETGRAHAMNLQITDGDVRSSSGIDGGYASLVQTEEGELLMDYFKTEITVTAPTGNSDSVYLINQYNPMDRILMYTPAWGEFSRGSQNNGVEMIVVDGKVSGFRMNQDPVAIPKNGYILTTSMECNYFLNSNFMIGDEVQLDITLTPDTDKIRHAISGGSMLVKDGERAEFTHNITGKHPRTGIGFTEDGHLLLVTVDGRQTGASGMSQEELADLFIELGATFAMNCDGGGSTTMVTRPEGSFDLALRNAPSGGSMRAVSAAVGLFSNAKIGTLANINSTVSAERIFVGDAVSVYSVG